MSLNDIVRGVEVAIGAIVEYRDKEDIKRVVEVHTDEQYYGSKKTCRGNGKIFNRQLELNQSLSDSLSQLSKEQSTYLQLLDYYQSQTYMEDLELSNKGYFNGIPCGVLSEDGVYNLLFDRTNLASQLRELADMLEQ